MRHRRQQRRRATAFCDEESENGLVVVGPAADPISSAVIVAAGVTGVRLTLGSGDGAHDRRARVAGRLQRAKRDRGTATALAKPCARPRRWTPPGQVVARAAVGIAPGGQPCAGVDRGGDGCRGGARAGLHRRPGARRGRCRCASPTRARRCASPWASWTAADLPAAAGRLRRAALAPPRHDPWPAVLSRDAAQVTAAARPRRLTSRCPRPAAWRTPAAGRATCGSSRPRWARARRWSARRCATPPA